MTATAAAAEAPATAACETRARGRSPGRTMHDVDLAPPATAFSGGGVATLQTPQRPRTVTQPQLEIDEEHLLGVTAQQKEPG